LAVTLVVPLSPNELRVLHCVKECLGEEPLKSNIRETTMNRILNKVAQKLNDSVSLVRETYESAVEKIRRSFSFNPSFYYLLPKLD
jgi:hypothetical protein